MQCSILNLPILILLSLSLFTLPSWAEDEDSKAPKALYYKFPEPITINLQRQSNKDMRLLQVKIALMSYNQELIDSASNNLPMLQNSLTTLFAEQTMDSVGTVDGRKAIQAMALKTLKTILKEEIGKDDLKAIYFTSFIMQ